MTTPSVTSPPAHRPGRAESLGAAASALVALGGAVALPLLAAAEPGAGIPSISPADAVWWAVAALVVLQAGMLLWAKRAPERVLSTVLAAPVLHAIVIPGGTLSLTTVAVSFAVVWVVLRERPRRFVPLLSVVALVLGASQTANDVRAGADLDAAVIVTAVLQALAVIGIPIAIGLFLWARQEARLSHANELAALEREREALIREAVSNERVSMSRELHDIAAHHMSGIALLAAAMQRQVDADPEAAKLSARQVRTQSTRALDDLRRVIGLLRAESDGQRSVEALAAVGDLVAQRRETGVDVTFAVHRAERELGAGVGPLAQLVVYRLVQESLANAATHAPGSRCLVEIDDRDPARLVVRVANDGVHAPDPGPGGGFGLVGMRERAELVGAALEYGPTGQDGWEVRLIVKRDAVDET